MILLFLTLTALYAIPSDDLDSCAVLCDLSMVHTTHTQDHDDLVSALHQSIQAMCFSLYSATPSQSANPILEESIRKRKYEPTSADHYCPQKVSKTHTAKHVHSKATQLKNTTPSPNDDPSNTAQPQTQELEPVHPPENLTTVLPVEINSSGHFPLSMLPHEGDTQKMLPNTPPSINIDDSLQLQHAPPSAQLTTLFVSNTAEQMLRTPDHIKTLTDSIYQASRYSLPVPNSIAKTLLFIHEKLPPTSSYHDLRFCIKTLIELCSFLLSQPPLDLSFFRDVRKQYLSTPLHQAGNHSYAYRNLLFLRSVFKLTYTLQTFKQNIKPKPETLTSLLLMLKIDDENVFSALDHAQAFLKKTRTHPQLQIPRFTNSAIDLCRNPQRKINALFATLKEMEQQASYISNELTTPNEVQPPALAVITEKSSLILQRPAKMQELIYSLYQEGNYSTPAPSSLSEMLSLMYQETPSARKYDSTRFYIKHLGELCAFLLARPPLNSQLLSEVKHQYRSTPFPQSANRGQHYQNMFFIRTVTKLTYALQTLRENLTPANQTLKQILQTLEINDSCICTALKRCLSVLHPLTLHPQLQVPLVKDHATDLCQQVTIDGIVKILQIAELEGRIVSLKQPS